MKKHLIFIFFLMLSAVFHQAAGQNGESMETEARGTGLKREDALQDALRNAIGQAVGVSMNAETRVENFMVISDAIASKTSGYIQKYEVVKETPFPDRYEISIKATVTTAPIKADFSMLAKAIGGVRFMVVYDPRNMDAEQTGMYDLAVDRMNEYLSSKGYRYIERKRFESLRTEAIRILEADQSEISFVQQLGMQSGAQFIISLSNLSSDKRSEQFDTRSSVKISLQAKAYDNCTAEGLGTLVFESDRVSSSDAAAATREGIREAVMKNAEQLTARFITYIGDWLNNGTPYELRFYNVGGYRDFRDLRVKMKELSQFGGDMEIVSVNNYSKLNCTFKKKPDELADKVLDIADEIPALKEKRLDVKLIYGRQINFAPSNAVVPELQDLQKQLGGEPNGTGPGSSTEVNRKTPSEQAMTGTIKSSSAPGKKGKSPAGNIKAKSKPGLKPAGK